MRKRTDRECSNCEDGWYYKHGHDITCGTCGYTPSRTMRSEKTDPWEEMREQRREKDASTGHERKRCVGGFIEAYDSEGSLY